MNAAKKKHDEEARKEGTHPEEVAGTEDVVKDVEPQGDASSVEGQLRAALEEKDLNYQRWARAQADLENYRKRMDREREQERRYHPLPLVRDLLPALDNLHRAIQAASDTENAKDLVQGVQMVANQMEEILKKHSVVPIEAIGQPFDPNFHEALQHMPSSEHPAMTVVQELERGYKMHDRVVRPSKVIVSSGPPKSAETAQSDSNSSQEEA